MEKDNLNIVVVDDSVSVREVLSNELNTLGYTAVAVSSIEESKNALSLDNINMMFLDIKLHGTSGLE